jgi:hypothetical protein
MVAMTENEAIREFQNIRPHSGMIPVRMAEAVDTAIQALEEVQQYRQIGTVEECREAVEKQTKISREIIEGKYFCPKCHNLMPYPGYCGCGQKVY